MGRHAAAGGVWHLLVRATTPIKATLPAADEEMPDADPRRALPEAHSSSRLPHHVLDKPLIAEKDTPSQGFPP